MTDQQSADFDSIDQLLKDAGASWEAAEAHAAFCGRACLAGAAAIKPWVMDVLPDAEGTDVLAAERAGKLKVLAANTLINLEAGDMRFGLLLPDDGVSISFRTAALVDWCHGFMHGLVAGGGADQGRQSDALDSAVVSEILDDFNEIAKAGAADEEGEEAEQAFAEITEYVRVSVQLVYDETASLRASSAAGGSS